MRSLTAYTLIRSLSRVKSTRRLPTRNRYSCVFAVSFFTSPERSLCSASSLRPTLRRCSFGKARSCCRAFFDLKPVAHRSFSGNRLTQIAVEPRAGSNSRYSRESRVEHVGTLRSFPYFKNKNALRFNHELTRIDTISGGTTSVSSHYFPGWDSARPSK